MAVIDRDKQLEREETQKRKEKFEEWFESPLMDLDLKEHIQDLMDSNEQQKKELEEYHSFFNRLSNFLPTEIHPYNIKY